MMKRLNPIPFLSLAAFFKTTALKTTAAITTLLVFAACTGGGPGVEETPAESGAAPITYNGPIAENEDIQRFQTFFWNNLRSEARCGACHGDTPASGTSLTFARSDDVNLAYRQLIPETGASVYIDFITPNNADLERNLVNRVAQGHNCWITDQVDNLSACENDLTAFVKNWAGGAVAEATELVLSAPDLIIPSPSTPLPEVGDFTTFYNTIRNTYGCNNCHSETPSLQSQPQQPQFASNSVDTAYDAITTAGIMSVGDNSDLVSLANAQSRLVVKLRDQSHNCWTNDCMADAQAMLDSIKAFIPEPPPGNEIPSEWSTSKALTLYGGIQASQGNRFDTHVIAKYIFDEPLGSNLANDTSGIEPKLNLQLSGNVEFIGGFGINLTGGKAQASTSDSRKLYNVIRETGEYAIEAWVAPANVTQEGPARIITYSGGSTSRNFMLGQTLYNYNFLSRNSNSDNNGEPAISTPDGNDVLQATLQHVVVNYDAINGRSIYVNGQLVSNADPEEAGTFANWDDTFALVIGSEPSGQFPFHGIVRFAAIHRHVLTQDQIQANFDAGVGEKFLLLFGIGQFVDGNDTTPADVQVDDVPKLYVMFQASQFDSYSYLFEAPVLIHISDNNPNNSVSALPDNLRITDMRIGINGEVQSGGQAYRSIDTNLSLANLKANGETVPIHNVGTVVELQQGPAVDEFFLTFEVLGTETDGQGAHTADIVPTTPAAIFADEQPKFALRTYEEIYSTMSDMTGVSKTNTAVQTLYTEIKQALPSTEDINTFGSSHQMAIARLAIQFCDEWGRGNSSKSLTFDASSAFIGNITDIVSGTNLDGIQPDRTDIINELNTLNSSLGASTSNLDKSKGICAAALGSAVMLVQ